MFEIVLHQPQIPPNTGNAIRLSANTGANLHLVEPLGFEMSDAKLRRAGLDYHDLARVRVHASWAALRAALPEPERRWYAYTARGRTDYTSPRYRPGDVLVLGAEQNGLPDHVLAEFEPPQSLRVPMMPGSRSLNLSNTVAIAVYEAWRQNSFDGAGPRLGR